MRPDIGVSAGRIEHGARDGIVLRPEGGEYQGPETGCSPETCPLVPTIRSSWGQIKGRFQEAK
ncbi:MAG: hypothetical protein KDA27_18525 [Candidatus Eisenbacteria bacterium]|uniref:Uncharacterized protein n=1 Tax=Eiseniibacteriota bacterium TaxID=2212470 RepID=A0A956SGV2_UNCEI|nr:hypothetical protein [Candidatus Eisenbacteria bacterium]MCB9462418.1 hypothetical protein [Candidatus Eisenbacteria bacterium]